MKKNAKNRRGFTIAELTIVLAVIAVVSTMVVSYVTIITQRNRAATERLNVMQDIQVIESMTEAWIEEISNIGVTDDTLISIDDTSVAMKFDLASSTYCALTKYETTAIKSVTYRSEGSDDILYFVTVTYALSDKNGLQTYTFCVNPYVGEGVN